MGAASEKVRVMKKGIHPDYHFVEVQLNDGTTYKTRTTYGTAGQKITVDIDPSTHPAWTRRQQQFMYRRGRLTRLHKKFAGLVKSSTCFHCIPKSRPATSRGLRFSNAP